MRRRSCRWGPDRRPHRPRSRRYAKIHTKSGVLGSICDVQRSMGWAWTPHRTEPASCRTTRRLGLAEPGSARSDHGVGLDAASSAQRWWPRASSEGGSSPPGTVALRSSPLDRCLDRHRPRGPRTTPQGGPGPSAPSPRHHPPREERHWRTALAQGRCSRRWRCARRDHPRTSRCSTRRRQPLRREPWHRRTQLSRPSPHPPRAFRYLRDPRPLRRRPQCPRRRRFPRAIFRRAIRARTSPLRRISSTSATALWSTSRPRAPRPRWPPSTTPGSKKASSRWCCPLTGRACRQLSSCSW